MAGLISTFLITFVFALILTLGMIVTFKNKLVAFFGKKKALELPPESSSAGVIKKIDPIRAFVILLGQIFFTVAMWYICYDTAGEVLTLIKAGK